MALDIRYPGHRNSWGVLTEDSFTQSNPSSPTADTANTATTWANQVNTSGVLGGSVAFTRPDVGSNYIGGPGYTSAGAAVTEAGANVPLGLFINDAVGNAYENTPGIASGKGPYVCSGGTYKVDLYEDVSTLGGTLSDGTAVAIDATITYTAGMRLYASDNGILTGIPEDTYENVSGGFSVLEATVIGVVLQAPSSADAFMVIDLRI